MTSMGRPSTNTLRKMQEFIDAPEKKRTNDTYAERYRYVRAFFKFAKKDVIEGLKDKVKDVHNDSDMPNNSRYLPRYIEHMSKTASISKSAKACNEWRDAILELLQEHAKKESRFINDLYAALPETYSQDYAILASMKGGGAFPVNHRSKRWTKKKIYKRWVKNLSKPVTRHIQKVDLCVGDRSICKGHLGISRKYMPQFNSRAEIQQFTRFVKKAYGIKSHKTRKVAKELKSSQREINRKRVKDLIDSNIIKKVQVPILISGDDYVIDGHHRWAAYMLKAPEKKIPAVVVDAPIKDVLGIAVAWGAKHQEF